MMSKLVAVLGVVGVSLLAGCATADATDTTANNETVGTATSAARIASPLADRGVNQCVEPALSEMIHLVKLALTYQEPETKPAFFWAGGPGSRTELRDPNPASQNALDKMRIAYEMETGFLFDENFQDFVQRLVTVAQPALSMDTACGAKLNYFVVPFTPSEVTTVLPKLDWFFTHSQHKAIANRPCPSKWLADQGKTFPNGTICAFTDPNFAAGDNDPRVSPHIFGGATGVQNWAEVAGTTFVATTDPNTSWDSFGMSTVRLTVYRGPLESTTMRVGDTAAFRMEYSGMDYGTWQATIIGGASTGSKATYRLDSRIY